MNLQTRIAEELPRLNGWCVLEKALAIEREFDRIKPLVAVEIGVFGGSSFIPQAMCAQSANFGHCWGIDPYSAEESLRFETDPKNREYWGGLDYDEIYSGCLKAIQRNNLESFCTVLRLTANKCAGMFESIDFLHIDGSHDKENSCADVFNYVPKVRQGGVIFFDDCDWVQTQPALKSMYDGCKFLYQVSNTAVFEKL